MNNIPHAVSSEDNPNDLAKYLSALDGFSFICCCLSHSTVDEVANQVAVEGYVSNYKMTNLPFPAYSFNNAESFNTFLVKGMPMSVMLHSIVIFFLLLEFTGATHISFLPIYAMETVDVTNTVRG